MRTDGNEPSASPTPSRSARRARRFQVLAERPLLGPYRLCAEIAGGGMATVYLADTPGGRVRQPVAIKRIHPHLAKDRVFVEMFYDEAAIASRIRHPNVCHVFDHDEHDGEYFLVMEYLVGEPLSRIVRALRRKQDLDWRQHALMAAAIVADAARGLHAAHELLDESGEPLDVVHRDISPDNIFLTFDGMVKVVDFGVASASRQLHRTQTGMLKGKYAYLQPEVLSGARADRRADIWGLGVVLWELLVLQRLFNRTTDFETLRAVNEAEIQSPSTVVPAIPRELGDIVMKILSRDPRDRYATAKEVEQALTRFLASRGVSTSTDTLASWLAGIFPDGLARQQQFIDIALGSPDGEPRAPALSRASQARVLSAPLATPTSSAPPTRAAPLPSASDDAQTAVFSTSDDSHSLDPTHLPTRSTSIAAAGRTLRRGARVLPAATAAVALATSGVAIWSLEASDAAEDDRPARAGSMAPETLRGADDQDGPRSGDENARGGVHMADGDREPVRRDLSARAARGGDRDDRPSETPKEPSEKASLPTKAIALQLPDDLLKSRRPAQSPPIELGRGSYRLVLTPHDGEWSLTIVPHRPEQWPTDDSEPALLPEER